LRVEKDVVRDVVDVRQGSPQWEVVGLLASEKGLDNAVRSLAISATPYLFPPFIFSMDLFTHCNGSE
jgi:hypothetical protein